MAENVTVDNGGLTDYIARTRETSAGIHAQRVDVGPWVPTIVSGAEYDLEVLTSGITTLTVPSGATHVLLTVEDNDVRFTEDNSSPSTGAEGNGLLLQAGFIGELALPLVGGSPQALKFIAVSATANLNVSYRKYV